jgi:hypothetical protein
MGGAHVRAYAFSGSDGAVRSTRSIYCGFSLRETAGTTATVLVYDGTGASGTLLDSVSLAANESRAEFYPGGIIADTGIYIDVTGTVAGSFRVG